VNTVCDSFDAIASVLADFLTKHRVVYLKCDPEIIDFKSTYTGTITLLGAGGEGVQFLIPTTYLNTFVGLLSCHVFDKERVVFTWNIKNLFSYLYFRLPRSQQITVESKIIDIKYGESLIDVEGTKPETFEEAKKRARAIATNEKCKSIHSRIDIPLATRVIPKIETYGLKDAEIRKIRYSIYHIGDSENGRLKCTKQGNDGISTHNWKEEKIKFKPSQDNVFVDLDFKAMEVCVLQWLSKDERLLKIILSGRDIYTTIYSLLYGQKCPDDKRQFIKEVFLPIVYGMQANALSACGISRDEAETLITKINEFFHVAMSWVQSHKDNLKHDPVLVDFFGRVRRFEEGDNHNAVRNAIIQGPAAVICSDRLIALYDKIHNHCEIVANIHDAYILDVPKSKLYDVVYHAVETLQDTSGFPGLHLKTKVKVGSNLTDMKLFNL